MEFSWLKLEVTWLPGEHLVPQLTIDPDIGREIDSFDVVADRGAAYEWFDAFRTAMDTNSPLPPSSNALLSSQRETLTALHQGWDALETQLAAMYPARLRPYLHWSHIRVTDKEREGNVYVELSGYTSATFENEYDEHGLGAVLLGDSIIAAGHRDPTCARPALRRPKTALRANPYFCQLDLSSIEEDLASEDWSAVHAASLVTSEGEQLDQIITDWLWTQSPSEALRVLPFVLPLLQPLLYSGRELGERDVAKDPTVLRELVKAGRFQIPTRALHDAKTPERIRWWATVGARVDEGAGRHDKPAIVKHFKKADLLEALLELGADPGALFDSYGALKQEAGEEQLALLRQHHPKLMQKSDLSKPRRPTAKRTAKPPQSIATNTLSDWVRLGWLELDSGADSDAIDEILVCLLDEAREPEQLVDALLEVRGVAEVFIDNRTLERFLAAWANNS